VQETVRAYYNGWYADIVDRLPVIAGGRISPRADPGLGTALQPDVARRAGVRRRVTTAADVA
jgi:L-alanine-DL-glutamate epimerase-like enolase superfamily enzyme